MNRPLFALVLLAALAGCQQKTEESPAPPPVVRTVAPQPVSEAAGWRLTGRVVAERTASLAFRVAGQIAGWQVETGDHFDAGQVLMRLDDSDYRLQLQQVAAQMAATRSDLETARRDLRRYRDLLGRKLTSQQQVDAAQNRVTRLEAQLAALEPQRALAEKKLGYTRLVASRAGVVLKRLGAQGQVVNAGTPVLEVAYDGPRQAAFDWPETLGVPSQQARLKLPGGEVTATLAWQAPQADPVSRTWAVRYRLPAQVHVPLGATATLLPQQAAQSGLWALPNTAVRMEKAGARVLRVREGRIEPVPVEVVRINGERAWVRGPLSPRDQVVALGVHLLRAGEPVRVSGQ
ncbi:efflux RND transporter periplasmic adaptor subunit [Sulfurivirga sp.]|uniref:efflux RND transporter periplasmic adaptor subunit n=1 Tax=Sulfurivirga sp. TaxID=2614236 RepID=UPI0025EC3165|nr:efflux RND transporter periplasmic adaptor subunit [Sulfurivirga sp.]